MKASNNPDIALGQEWMAALEAWIDAHGLAGYDPFDVKQHPWIRAAQPYTLPRKATTALSDLFPNALRRWLRVMPTENPKAHALVAIGALRMFQLTASAAFLDKAMGHLDWLRDHAAAGYSGLCWGYPFDVFAKGVDTPRGTPVLVVSAIAGEAFLLAYAVTQEGAHLAAARSIASFILGDIPQMTQEDGTVCFGYTPRDRRRVHNANLLAAEHLFRVGAATGEAALGAAAEPALRFTIERQRADGAWHYGEYAPEEPFDAVNLRMIDNHHTGFVLRSLHGIQQARPEEATQEALKKGFRYYKKLFAADGMPITAQGRYPVDIHACTEGVLCPAVLSESLGGTRDMSILALRWAHFFLRDRVSQAPYYRKYPWGASKIIFPRWGVAWLYRAVAEYLYRFYR